MPKHHCPPCTQYMGEIRDATLRKGAGVICKTCIELAHAAIEKANNPFASGGMFEKWAANPKGWRE